MKTFVTGVSSGLGLGLAKAAILDGNEVYGLSRRACPVDLDRHVGVDLEDLESIPKMLKSLFKDVNILGQVVLNAGLLGPIDLLKDQKQADLDSLMKVNVWSNKVITDWLLKNMDQVGQVIMISSGASLNGNAGWGGYSISKAALNMLVKLYASEVPHVHFTALAPGLIESPMQEYLCGIEDTDKFPSLERLRNARGSEDMPSHDKAGLKIWKALPELLNHPSGSYLDIRKL